MIHPLFLKILLMTSAHKERYRTEPRNKCFLWLKHKIRQDKDMQYRCKRCGKTKVECVAGGRQWTKC